MEKQSDLKINFKGSLPLSRVSRSMVGAKRKPTRIIMCADMNTQTCRISLYTRVCNVGSLCLFVLCGWTMG